MREGINLNAESGIRNVVCCVTDEMHVKQFVGRCRFDVENLVVAHRAYRGDNKGKNDYLARSRRAFEEFLKDSSNREWFDSISDIFAGTVDDVIRIDVGGTRDDFCEMIDTRWACSHEQSHDEQLARAIYRESDKKSIVDYAFQCELLDKFKCRYTFNGVMKYLEDNCGYEIGCGRTMIEGKRVTYRIIYERNEKQNEQYEQ